MVKTRSAIPCMELDVDYRSDWPRLTKWLDKLPFYNSQEMSSITAYAEAAMLNPGHAPQIGKGNQGQVYIDDFEGTRSGIDLPFPIDQLDTGFCSAGKSTGDYFLNQP